MCRRGFGELYAYTIVQGALPLSMEWYEFPENIRFLARRLCMQGAKGWAIYDLFETPWDFTEQYELAIKSEMSDQLREFGL